ncbi:MAG: CopD family protein [Pseudomonadota bacterium]
MVTEVLSADLIVWLSILLKALTYAATLLAVGSPFILLALSSLDDSDRAHVVRVGVISALVAVVLSALRLPVSASYLMGGSWAGAFDPMILTLVAESPLGTSVAVRTLGLVLTLALLFRHRAALPLAATGSFVAALSFGLRGHVLEEPRVILAALVTVHILCLGLWIAALPPLMRAARVHDPVTAGTIAHEFGTKAIWVVAGLTSVGGAMLAVFGVLGVDALNTPYGQGFLIKLVLFAVVLGLAALNKLKLTPELQAAGSTSRSRLHRSIQAETGVIGLILLTTATLTTISSPG